jgi:ubiquinone/menaquinone biosynthesis C-methylase UbiE
VSLKFRKIFWGLLLIFLWLIYRFDKWHLYGTIYSRKYKQQVIDLANSVHPNSAIEIGCGLGDIISRVQANSDYKIGLDIDSRVISAAKILYSKHAKFIVGSLESPQINSVDIVIMVNWIHILPKEVLETMIDRIREFSKFVLVDAINKDRSGYSYYHDFSFMKSRGILLSKIECNEFDGRSLLLFKFN